MRPDRNPVEHLWKDVKNAVWRNYPFKSDTARAVCWGRLGQKYLLADGEPSLRATEIACCLCVAVNVVSMWFSLTLFLIQRNGCMSNALFKSFNIKHLPHGPSVIYPLNASAATLILYHQQVLLTRRKVQVWLQGGLLAYNTLKSTTKQASAI